MDFPALLISPSIWMQKTLFQIVEGERRAPLGQASQRPCDAYSLTIRVLIIAHGILQSIFAIVATVPVTVTFASTVILRPSPSGFLEREETTVERIKVAVIAALASLYLPVAASYMAVQNIESFSNIQSEAVALPILAHSFLFALSLPPLHRLPQPIQEALQGNTQEHQGFLHTLESYLWSSTAAEESAPEASLNEERLFRWRLALPTAILWQMKDRISHYDEALATTSKDCIASLHLAIKTVQEAEPSSNRSDLEATEPHYRRIGPLIDCIPQVIE